MKLFRDAAGEMYAQIEIRDSSNAEGKVAIIADIMGDARLCAYGATQEEADEYCKQRGIISIPARAVVMPNMIEIRHFSCPKCKRGENHFVFPTAQAVAIECPDCASRYWWAHHKNRLYDDATRQLVDDAHFMLIDYTPMPEERPEEKS